MCLECHRRGFQLGESSDCYTSFLWTRPRGEGPELELGTGPCPSDVNFLPHALRQLLASLHLIAGSALALGLWVEVSAPQPPCSAGACLAFPQVQLLTYPQGRLASPAKSIPSHLWAASTQEKVKKCGAGRRNGRKHADDFSLSRHP